MIVLGSTENTETPVLIVGIGESIGNALCTEERITAQDSWLKYYHAVIKFIFNSNGTDNMLLGHT